uniref:Uncharacterized protein n=1 Tax=Anopheles coluzzii TaxID=1518534 RepID=A0A8W7P139_ANOCL
MAARGDGHANGFKAFKAIQTIGRPTLRFRVIWFKSPTSPPASAPKTSTRLDRPFDFDRTAVKTTILQGKVSPARPPSTTDPVDFRREGFQDHRLPTPRLSDLTNSPVFPSELSALVGWIFTFHLGYRFQHYANKRTVYVFAFANGKNCDAFARVPEPGRWARCGINGRPGLPLSIGHWVPG